MNNGHTLIEVKVASIKSETANVKIIRLDCLEQPYSFKPGQWIDLHAPIEGKNIGGYTIISSPFEKGFIELAVKESTHHPVTQYLHQALKVGDRLRITQGQGHFYLKDEYRNSPLVFMAGGIGLTPIISMIRSLDQNSSAMKLFYSVSNEVDFVLRQELASRAVLTVTKKASTSWTGERSRINLEMLKKYQTDFNSHFFICGPRAMIDGLVLELKNAGVNASHIHFEKWW